MRTQTLLQGGTDCQVSAARWCQTAKCLLQGGVGLPSVCCKDGVRLPSVCCKVVSDYGSAPCVLKLILQTIYPQQPHPNINAIPAPDSETIGLRRLKWTTQCQNSGIVDVCVCVCVCVCVYKKKESSLTLFFFIQFFVCPKDIPRAGVGSHLEQRPIGSGIHSRLGLTTPVQTSRPGSSVKSRLE